MGESRKVKNLKFELQLNIKKIDKWIEETAKYRNAVNGDALNTYFGYFDLSRFITSTTNDMFLSGLLYKYLDYEALEKLQTTVSEFTLPFETYLNNEITQNRNKVIQEPASWLTSKRMVVLRVNFWDDKFKEHKKTLENIVKILSIKK